MAVRLLARATCALLLLQGLQLGLAQRARRLASDGTGELTLTPVTDAEVQLWVTTYWHNRLLTPPQKEDIEDVEIMSLPADVPILPACKRLKYSRYVRVKNAKQLQRAINASQPGDLIEMMPGRYVHPPTVNLTIYQRNGQKGNPITVCGSRKAVITTGSTEKGAYGLYVKESSFIRLVGFSIRKAFKGLVLDWSSNCGVRRLDISNTGYEGLRLRYNSTDNVVKECRVTGTGNLDKGFGEGIYIGSSWKEPFDRTNGNKILNNVIGPGVSAEMVDVKEYTQSGVIAYNFFNGTDLSNVNYADSWVDVKGSGWVVHNNIGFQALLDGFQTHDQDAPQSGESNVFRRNTCNLGTGTGVCVDIQCDHYGSVCDNKVRCDNVIQGGQDMTNVKSCLGRAGKKVVREKGE